LAIIEIECKIDKWVLFTEKPQSTPTALAYCTTELTLSCTQFYVVVHTKLYVVKKKVNVKNI